MKASFDKQELMAGLAELEKRAREQRPSGRPAAAPSDRLDLDLAAIEAAVKSRRAPKPAAVEPTAVAPEQGHEAAPSQSTTIEAALEAAALVAVDPREQTAPSRSAAIDLFADKEFRAAASKQRSAPSAAAVKDAARLIVELREQASPSRSPKIDSVPDNDLRASAPSTGSAPSRPHRWIYAATAILIIIGSLVGGAGWFVGGKVMAALQTPRSLRSKIDPPLESTAAPAPERTADVPPADAQETASTAGEGETASPAPQTQAAVPTVDATASQATQASQASPAVAAPPAAAAAASPTAAPPPAAKPVAAVDQPPAAATPPTSEAPAAKPAKPAKKPKKPTADKSEDKSDKDSGSKHHAKPKPDKVSKPRAAPNDPPAAQAPAPPQALAAPPPPPPAAANPDPGVLARAGQAVGSITGTVKGWVGLDSGAHPQ